MSRLNADILLFFTAGIWGVAFLFQKSATVHVGPLTFLALRGLIACLALAPLALREARRAAAPTRLEFYTDLVSRRRRLLDRRLAAAGWLGNRHRHQHGLSHGALRGHHAAHRLGLERQVAQPTGVAGRADVGARHLAAQRRRHARHLPGG